jgi:hypothetical protein
MWVKTHGMGLQLFAPRMRELPGICITSWSSGEGVLDGGIFVDAAAVRDGLDASLPKITILRSEVAELSVQRLIGHIVGQIFAGKPDEIASEYRCRPNLRFVPNWEKPAVLKEAPGAISDHLKKAPTINQN